MRTIYILVDFENVRPKSLASFAHEQFKVIVFVGANQTKVPLDLATELQRMGSKAEYIQIAGNGPNALDFHIAYYIGKISAADPDAYFHIISKDTGFDVLIQHLKANKILAKRTGDINIVPLKKDEDKKSLEERTQRIVSILRQPKSTRPRTVKTLTSSIAAQFQNQLTDTEIADIIANMKNKGVIAISDGKISYTL